SQRGSRIRAIVDELKGEMIDVIKWSGNPEDYIASSLSPAKVLQVNLDEENKVARVVVPDFQLSLAIGKEGQNARLAAKLTGWKIDIKSESQLRNQLEAQLFHPSAAVYEQEPEHYDMIEEGTEEEMEEGSTDEEKSSGEENSEE
ncbi:MAG TPA: transcription termination/antitermination protein NusA, partial [Ruminiclostridium sp.]|nr:transcription termination/antitermination protein NusA [Ruminiclostridium sp.]